MLFGLMMMAACAGSGGADDTGAGGGDLSLSPGFAEEVVGGEAAGEEELTTCEGFFPTAPQHMMTLSSAMTGLYLEADTDAVLLRVTFTDNGSEFCSDLDSGLPRIERGSWSAGAYEIYVGLPEEGGAVDYVLTAYE